MQAELMPAVFQDLNRAVAGKNAIKLEVTTLEVEDSVCACAARSAHLEAKLSFYNAKKLLKIFGGVCLERPQ